MAHTWTKLPDGQDVPLTPGGWVAVVASVHKSTTKADVEDALAKFFPGLILSDYGEQGDPGRAGLGPDPDGSRKYVVGIVHSTSYRGSLGWSKSIPILAPSVYELRGAWSAPSGDAPPATPPFPAPVGAASSAEAWGWSVVLLGAGGWAAWHWGGPHLRAWWRRARRWA